MSQRYWISVGLLAWCAVTAEARMVAYSPALAVRTKGSPFLALSVTGEGFGAPAPSAALLVNGFEAGVPVRLEIPSTDPRVFVWKDVQIVVKLPPALDRAHAMVVTPGHRSQRVRAAYYRHDTFDTSEAGGANSPPTHIAIDPAGRVWVNPEYKVNYYFFDPDAERVRPALFPRAATPAPFRECMGRTCVATRDPSGGEAIVIDDLGRVWMPESGGAPGDGEPRNHGRVIMYDPQNRTVRLYNLPGDHNGTNGIAWDKARRRIWLSQTNDLRFGNYANMLSFDPEGVPFEVFDWDIAMPPPTVVSAFDFTTEAACQGVTSTVLGTCSNAPHHACVTADDCVLAHLLCAPGVSDDGACYHEYPLGIFEPAHVAVHPDGHVWFTDYSAGMGSRLGRLDPTDGAVELFPLAAAPFLPRALPLDLVDFGLTAPWDIEVERDGAIVATEYASCRIARFPVSKMIDTTACHNLYAPDGTTPGCGGSYDPATGDVISDPTCTNPCIEELLVPGTWAPDSTHPPLTHVAEGRLLEVKPDLRGNVWVDQGYVDRMGHFHLWPPLLALYPDAFTAGQEPSLYSGIGGSVAVDPRNGDIWGADYMGRRLNRLSRLFPRRLAVPQGGGS
jgi:streptogramin lyase